MGRYIEQNEGRSELQQRIAADLRAKAAEKAKQEGGEGASANSHDGVEDSAYIRGTKSTTSLAWAWVLIFFAVIAIFILFAVRSN